MSDFTGDGKVDIARTAPGGFGLELLRSTGAGFDWRGSWTSEQLAVEGDRWYVGHFNPDEFADIFRYAPGVSGADMFLYTHFGPNHHGSWTGAGLAIEGDRWYTGDFNGDGKDDIFRYAPGVSGADMYLSIGSAFDHAGSWTGAGLALEGDRWYVGDFNGDGKDDTSATPPGISGVDVFLSTGSGFEHAGSWTSAGLAADERWYVGDFNGDAKDDIFRYVPGVTGADMFLSTGSGFEQVGSWTSAGLAVEGDRWYVGNFDGKGGDDIFRYNPGFSGADMFLSPDTADRFVFRTGYGHETVTDFQARGGNHDGIELDHMLAPSFAEVMSHAEDTNHGTLITFDAATSILLENVAKANLTADDFHFT